MPLCERDKERGLPRVPKPFRNAKGGDLSHRLQAVGIKPELLPHPAVIMSINYQACSAC